MEKYASEYVCEEDREDFLRNVDYRVVRRTNQDRKSIRLFFKENLMEKLIIPGLFCPNI